MYDFPSAADYANAAATDAKKENERLRADLEALHLRVIALEELTVLLTHKLMALAGESPIPSEAAAKTSGHKEPQR